MVVGPGANFSSKPIPTTRRSDNHGMTWQRILTLVIAVALGAGAWRAGGWAGLALAGSALVLWFMLYYTRLIQVMKRAADRPVGYVGSAVMLNAKLKPRKSLLHVIALTRSLGQTLSPAGTEPEVYRWTDPGGSHVTADFEGGKLVRWHLERPDVPADETAAPSVSEKVTVLDGAPTAPAAPVDARAPQA